MIVHNVNAKNLQIKGTRQSNRFNVIENRNVARPIKFSIIPGAGTKFLIRSSSTWLMQLKRMASTARLTAEIVNSNVVKQLTNFSGGWYRKMGKQEWKATCQTVSTQHNRFSFVAGSFWIIFGNIKENEVFFHFLYFHPAIAPKSLTLKFGFFGISVRYWPINQATNFLKTGYIGDKTPFSNKQLIMLL